MNFQTAIIESLISDVRAKCNVDLMKAMEIIKTSKEAAKMMGLDLASYLTISELV